MEATGNVTGSWLSRPRGQAEHVTGTPQSRQQIPGDPGPGHGSGVTLAAAGRERDRSTRRRSRIAEHDSDPRVTACRPGQVCDSRPAVTVA